MSQKFPLQIGLAVIRPYRSVNGTESFEIDFGRVNDARLRIYRRTITLAIETARRKSREIKKHGDAAFLLTTAQRVEAAKCFARLDGASLTNAVEFYLHQHPPAHRDKTLKLVAAELVKKKTAGNRRERYVNDLEWKFDLLLRFFPDRQLASITTEDMERFIAAQNWSPVSQKRYIQSYNVLFNYAVRRGYIAANPCLKLEMPESDQEEPPIFTVEKMKTLLRLCVTTTELKECLPLVAIGAFAGLRPTEIERLDWAEVDVAHKTITVLGAKAKGRARRVVDMSDNLAAWLLPIAKATGPVIPCRVREHRDRLKVAAGWTDWPHDALRHSFASYHFAHHRDQKATCYQMGHGDAQVLFSHYRSLVTPPAAAAFWNLYPHNLESAPRPDEKNPAA